MRGLLMGWRAVGILLRGGFIIVLAAAAWQDLRERRIRAGVLVISGGTGAALRSMQIVLEWTMARRGEHMSRFFSLVRGHLWDIGLAMAVGGGLLLLSAVSGEAVGRGDGWFFVVSGLYLGAVKNLLLLAGGVAACFVVCLALIVRGIMLGAGVRRMRLPFLPFLVPAGIGVMLL